MERPISDLCNAGKHEECGQYKWICYCGCHFLFNREHLRSLDITCGLQEKEDGDCSPPTWEDIRFLLKEIARLEHERASVPRAAKDLMARTEKDVVEECVSILNKMLKDYCQCSRCDDERDVLLKAIEAIRNQHASSVGKG